jgi:hypothetical protein
MAGAGMRKRFPQAIQTIEGMEGDTVAALGKFREYCLDQTQIMPAVQLEN